jgi:hypothetical protein
MTFQPPRYCVQRADAPPALDAAPDHASWSAAAVAQIQNFHCSSSDHRPQTSVRLLHDDRNLYLQFEVNDRYVRSVQTRYQACVCTDSCIEFFVQPRPDRGYFNFELNCGGAMMLMYIEDPTWVGGAMRRISGVWPDHAQQIKIHHSLPTVIEREIIDAVTWRLALAVPLEIFSHYVGAVTASAENPWRGNFYKCADGSSHPHWASWAPMNGCLNFHQPQYFGDLVFGN